MCFLQKVNEKAQVINDYEAGRGIPNQMVIGKIERVLGIKLRGKDRGKPLTVTPGTKKWISGGKQCLSFDRYILFPIMRKNGRTEHNKKKRNTNPYPLFLWLYGYCENGKNGL